MSKSSETDDEVKKSDKHKKKKKNSVESDDDNNDDDKPKKKKGKKITIEQNNIRIKGLENKIQELENERESWMSERDGLEADLIAKEDELREWIDKYDTIYALNKKLQRDHKKEIESIHKHYENIKAENDYYRANSIQAFNPKPKVDIEFLVSVVRKNLSDISAIFCAFLQRHYVKERRNIKRKTAETYLFYDGKKWFEISKKIIAQLVIMETFAPALAQACAIVRTRFEQSQQGDDMDLSDNEEQALAKLNEYATKLISNEDVRFGEIARNELIDWFKLTAIARKNFK